MIIQSITLSPMAPDRGFLQEEDDLPLDLQVILRGAQGGHKGGLRGAIGGGLKVGFKGAPCGRNRIFVLPD